MAPLTRNRASAGQLPNELMREYYAQRADPATGAGLIITEATQVCPEGQGYLDTPGIHSAEQVAGWRRITDAVHARGGRIVVQLWHVGRISHVSLQPGGAGAGVEHGAAGARQDLHRRRLRDLLAAARAGHRRDPGRGRALPPRRAECHRGRLRRRRGARRQRLPASTSSCATASTTAATPMAARIENRVRFLLEVMQAVVGAIGGGRTGLRLSPVTPSNDAGPDSDPQALHEHAVAQLAPLKLAYLHVVEGQTGGARDFAPFDYAALRRRFNGAWMVNNGYTRAMALDAVASGAADLVAFGKPFIANPDLGRRLREDAPLNAPDTATFYGGGAAGYTDYPTLDVAPA